MAQKLNSEFNYRTQVIGETPWAKIQTLQGFLVGRKRAAVLERVSAIQYRARLSELEYLKSVGALEHIILRLEAEVMEAESFLEDAHICFRLNEDEIATLERLLAELYLECEHTRIPGYTDEQMYEANAANEFTVGILKEIHSEMLANGRPSPARLLNAMSNPTTWNAVKQLGFAPANAEPIAYIGGYDANLKITGE